MAIAVGIDPSLTSAGVAIIHNGQPTHLSHHGYSGHNGASWQSRSRRVRWTCGQIINAIGLAIAPVQTTAELIPSDWSQIDLVVIEGPSYGSQHGAQFDRIGVWHGVFAAFDARNIPIAVVAPKTRTRWATGKGTDDKRTVYEAVKADWTSVQLAAFNEGGNDEADALTMAAMGALHLGDDLPIALPQWRINGLTSVAWPEVVKTG